MRPHYWFGLAAIAIGAGLGVGVGLIEQGVRAYARDNSWDRALSEETAKTDGISRPS